MNEKITVLVADDNSDFTMTLSSYLEKEEQIQIVGIAKDGNEAYEKAIELKPDIIIRYNYATFGWTWSSRKIRRN